MAEFSFVALRVLAEVARLGSFSAAAEALGYTQSAVSRQVALAERAAGVALFERHPRGATLTPAGEIVLRRSGSALAELRAARVELDELAQRRSRAVRLGAFSTAMAALVPQALMGLEPHVEVQLREGLSGRLCERVAAGRLDLAVVTVTGTPVDGVEIEWLLEDRLLVALPRGHRLAGSAVLEPEELRREDWIAGSSDPASSLLGAWTSGRWKPRIAFEVRDWTAKIGLVAGGFGLTVVPALSARTLPPSVCVAAIDDPAARRTVALATRMGGVEPRVASMLEALRAAAPIAAGDTRSGRIA